MENPNFLKKKYNLHNAPEVESAAKRTEAREGEKAPRDSEARIQNYLDRFREIIEREDPHERERGMDALKKVLYDKFVIKSEEIPESYFDSIKRRHKREGHGDIEIPEDYRNDLANDIIKDQEKSLSGWIDYLSSKEAKYPNWLKYYAMRNILKMGRYDKKTKKFTERYGGTIAPFPDRNREALAITLGDIEKKENKESKFAFTGRHDIKQETKQKYLDFLAKKNFPKMYALAIEEFKPIPEELLKITEGKWVKYSKSSNHMPLVNSISNYGTGWCLRGESMAERYLVRDNNDLHIYYSNDKSGSPVVPRVVMVINNNNKITEVRGVAEEENLDLYIGDIVGAKLGEPEFEKEGKVYEKKSSDMKRLTGIEKKTKAKQELTKDDLIFLYEIDSSIEGFGYQDDPRVKELRKQRNQEEDMLIIFECEPDQIARNMDEVNENTKAYVGEWNPTIFQTIRKYPNIKHLYESFPDKKIFMQTLETDPTINSPEKAEEALKAKNILLPDWGKEILYKTEFSKEGKTYELVQFTVAQIGFPNGATTDEIYAKARELGMELCPAEVGPHLRLAYKGRDWKIIAMEQIAGHDGHTIVFRLHADAAGLELGASGSSSDSRCLEAFPFVFLSQVGEASNLDGETSK